MPTPRRVKSRNGQAATAVVYARISRDRSGDELGVDRQRRACLELADARGLDVVEVYTDDDRSAYSGRDRPAYRALVEAVAAGGVDYVIAWHPDRLTRRARELEDLVALLDDTGTNVLTVQAGEYDLATPDGRMVARISGSIAQRESEHRGARLKAKHAELAAAGRWHGGRRPFGYRPTDSGDLVVDPVEADAIRGAVARFLAGDTLTAVARWLDDEGHRTAAGARWSTSTLRGLLRSPTPAGLREHHGKATPAQWPAIITRAEHRRLVATLNSRRTYSGHPPRLLTGLARCGTCGAGMVSGPRDDGRATYRCQNVECPRRVSTLGDRLDAYVVGALLAAAESGRLAQRLALRRRPTDDTVEAELAELEDRAAELATAYADGLVELAVVRQASDRLAENRRRVEARLAAAPVADVGLDDLTPSRWEAMPHDRRRAVLAAAIDAVVVDPGRAFPARVELRWR